MPLKIEFDHPDFEKDVEIDLGGFLVKNGGSAELTEEQERLFVSKNQMGVKDSLAANQFAKVTGSSSITAKDMESIVVESNQGEEPETPADEEEKEGEA